MSKRRQWPPAPEPLPFAVPDNHTHLEVIAKLAPHPTPSVADYMTQAQAVGIDRIVQVGCDLESARWTSELLTQWATDPALARVAVGAVAIHPNDAVLHAGVVEPSPDGHTHHPTELHQSVPLDDAISQIADIARSHERIRAIGETGMDLFRTGQRGAQAQRESFRAHIALAKELGLALQIHDREAHQEVIDILRADGAPERTVFHCYSGDAQMAQYCAEQGWFLSFAGPVTYPANHELRAALRAVPLSQVLVETDAPYLPPHPFRGQVNAPYVAAWTVRAIADILEQDLTAVCEQIHRTSEAVYGAW